MMLSCVYCLLGEGEEEEGKGKEITGFGGQWQTSLLFIFKYKHQLEDPRKEKRTRIPYKPNYSLNLWSIMKNCIGKELSKIPMPVSPPQGIRSTSWAGKREAELICKPWAVRVDLSSMHGHPHVDMRHPGKIWP